ncbi:hypothetical protein BDW02DRAFT_617228 [Decorospora gaudefroyi]|uniref:Uncharacterized protein n=1 Tax=Decorospora gaudefroyi TaxID=184978 RepID=A0A6A5K179_9PLEO|nr:hypothetical protein BDW02DRAFT_617228 [Decorospora gaudefroyi]
MATVDYGIGSTATGMAKLGLGGRGGSGGGGKKPPRGGRGGLTRHASPPKKKPSGTWLVMEALMRAGLLNLQRAGVRLPHFLIDIANAHIREANGQTLGNFLVRPQAPAPNAETLFHWLYRAPRRYINDMENNPARITTLQDMNQFHERVMRHGAASGGTIGPHPSMLASLLLFFVVGAVAYVAHGDVTQSNCACNNCHDDDWPCTQVVDDAGSTQLFGRCLMCWRFNRHNCSMDLARHDAAADPASTPSRRSRAENWEAGRFTYHQFFPPGIDYHPAGARSRVASHFGGPWDSPSRAQEAQDLSPSVRRTQRAELRRANQNSRVPSTPQPSASNPPLGRVLDQANRRSPRVVITREEQERAIRLWRAAGGRRVTTIEPATAVEVAMDEAIACTHHYRTMEMILGDDGWGEETEGTIGDAVRSPEHGPRRSLSSASPSLATPGDGGRGMFYRGSTFSPTLTAVVKRENRGSSVSLDEFFDALEGFPAPTGLPEGPDSNHDDLYADPSPPSLPVPSSPPPPTPRRFHGFVNPNLRVPLDRRVPLLQPSPGPEAPSSPTPAPLSTGARVQAGGVARAEQAHGTPTCGPRRPWTGMNWAAGLEDNDSGPSSPPRRSPPTELETRPTPQSSRMRRDNTFRDLYARDDDEGNSKGSDKGKGKKK